MFHGRGTLATAWPMTLDFENISENGFRKTKSPDPVKKIVNMNLRSFKPLW